MDVLKDIVREGDKFTGVERACWHEFIIYYLNCLSVLAKCTINDIVIQIQKEWELGEPG